MNVHWDSIWLKKKKKLPLLKGSLVDQLLVCSVLSSSYHIPKLHMEL